MLKLYNTLIREKQTFKPLKDKRVGIYTCGPTVYDSAHIGNLRTYIFEDILKRTLIYNSYKVKHIMNITDIEDKIIKKMQAEGKTLEKTTAPFIEKFYSDLKKLNIIKANAYPKATENIPEIIKLIKILLEKGFAYKGADNSIYFNVRKFENYGRLSNLKNRQIKIGTRISSDEYEKENAADFALWKSAKQKEPFWKSPFGVGRPGWHIECSAMGIKYLGKTFDIHCGAVDLIFPHHENEIAQSEAATGKKFVNFWIEGEHLLVDGKKMSKSLGNFYTLNDIEKRSFSPLAFRYLMLNAHYRSPLNFTWKAIKGAQKSLDNLKNFIADIKKEKNKKNAPLIKKMEQKFLESVNDDLNMPKALAILWEVLKNNEISGGEKQKLILKFDKILGLELKEVKKTPIPQEIKLLIEKREQLRNKQQWLEADKIRQDIEKKGWIVEDTKAGTQITKLK